MSPRVEALTEEFGAWLSRYSPRTHLRSQPDALRAERYALTKVVFKMAPKVDYLTWLQKLTEALDYQMRTTAWPTVHEVGAVASNLNKDRSRKAGTTHGTGSLDPAVINAQRWSWIFDQFYAAQRSDFGFMSRSKPQSWFLSSIGFGWGQQAMG